MPASEERIAAARRRIDAYNSMSPEEKEKVHNSTTQSRLLARARRLAQAKKPAKPKESGPFEGYIRDIEEKLREDALRKKQREEAAKRGGKGSKKKYLR